MGGGTTTPPATDTGEEEDSSLLDQESSQLSSPLLRSELSMRAEDGAVGKQIQIGSVCGEYGRLRDFEANERMRQNVYRKILESGESLLIRSKGLEQAKSRVLRYTPGAWIETAGAMKRRNYDVPKTTTLLLVGPKGSGKSSLVNRISKALEDDKFASERAQVSYNSSVGDGTLFLQEYMIPRGSTSFCIYDTRSLSDDSAENTKMLNHWMENGVHHGELAIRDSDSQSSRTAMMCKARDSGYLSEFRKVNFVIFAVNGLSVLKSLESEEDAETQYTQLIASAFNCPYLAFKDDKPAVVVTHGDLLSHDERARVRVHLGELLGIPPTTQIFDIPESSDPVTESTIIDMLRYSLEHAEKNIPHKKKVLTISPLPCMLLLMLLGTATNLWCMYRHAHVQQGPSPLPLIQHCQSPQAHIQHCPSPQEHIPKEHFPQGHIEKEPWPQEQIQHCTSPEAHVQHDCGPLPKILTQHGPSSPLASSTPSPLAAPSAPSPLSVPIAHKDGSLPPENIQDASLPPSPQAHAHHDPSPPNTPSPQTHLYHGPLPRVQAELKKIRTKVEKFTTKLDWSKIRHLYLDEDSKMHIDWKKIRHLYLDEDSKIKKSG